MGQLIVLPKRTTQNTNIDPNLEREENRRFLRRMLANAAEAVAAAQELLSEEACAARDRAWEQRAHGSHER